jgi:hypothetical protein
MKTIRPVKRSVSPFVLSGDFPSQDPVSSPLEHALNVLQNALTPHVGLPKEPYPIQLKAFEDLVYLPSVLRAVADAPANDAPQLLNACQTIVRFRQTIHEKGLTEAIHNVMKEIFFLKVQLFMIDHYDDENGPRDIILFSKERDLLIGNYFAPMADDKPGLFSEFVATWTETENKDPLLHFLDFCGESKNPTFEWYLLFSHPALARVIRDKHMLKSLFDKAAPLLKKLASSSWEKQTRATLGL